MADPHGNIIDTVTGLHRDIASFYDFIRCKVDGVLAKVRTRLMEAFNREARRRQQSIQDAAWGAGEEIGGLFDNAPGAIDMKMQIIVGRASDTIESVQPETALLHSASLDAQAGVLGKRSGSDHVPQKQALLSAMPGLSETSDPFDHLGYGALAAIFVV